MRQGGRVKTTRALSSPRCSEGELTGPVAGGPGCSEAPARSLSGEQQGPEAAPASLSLLKRTVPLTVLKFFDHSLLLHKCKNLILHFYPKLVSVLTNVACFRNCVLPALGSPNALMKEILGLPS